MDQNKLKKGCAITLAGFVVLALLLYLIGGEQFHYREDETDMLSQVAVVEEITADDTVEQEIQLNGNVVGLSLLGATYNRTNTRTLELELLKGDTVLDHLSVDVSQMADNQEHYVPLHNPITESGTVLLRITAPESEPDNAVTLYYGSLSEERKKPAEDTPAKLNGKEINGALCVSLTTKTKILFGDIYWYCVGVLLAVLGIFSLRLLKANERGETTQTLKLLHAFSRYRFLMKQLVARDFKTKYKRSVLGVLWSFLNPLLTMTVQYIIFSTLFRSSIPNFALYLLIGVVCFSFFSEATNMTLSSIVGNASLITKVYVPKYIYPVTRVLSSAVNFLLSLVPLLLVVLITRTPIRFSFLLVPLVILCLMALCLGVGMLLASAMVFFRDTQFLWGVVLMLWMYATPIFYPETILPDRLLPLFKCNPLYHIIRFFRTALMNGVSPEPKAYALMLLASLIPLLLGVLVFKKTQDKFILYL